MTENDAPTVYVIAGPNGAGKTTFATEFLPKVADPPEFLNADLIAQGLSPLAPETQNIRAGRILLERMRELTCRRQTFGFETTLSGQTHLRHVAGFRTAGYRILLFFLWLPSADLAVARVANRVLQGGHGVPEQDIRRRYEAGINRFVRRFRDLVDGWWLFDSSQRPPELLAECYAGEQRILNSSIFRRIVPH